MCGLELLGLVLGFAALWLSELTNILVAPDPKQAKALLGAALLLPVSVLLQRQIH